MMNDEVDDVAKYHRIGGIFSHFFLVKNGRQIINYVKQTHVTAVGTKPTIGKFLLVRPIRLHLLMQ